MASERWSEEDTKLALFLYFQLPYGKLHKGNPEIQRLADFLGRTHSSVAMKLGNFASLDPVVTETGRKGLSGASKLDQIVFDRFSANWTALVDETEAVWNKIIELKPQSVLNDVTASYKFKPYEGASSTQSFSTMRLGQSFFRRAVLANYDDRCCVTGISDKRLLNTSHIKPWSIDEENRHNPANGIALSATFDRAFDRGLMTINGDGRISFSSQLLALGCESTRQYFSKYDGKSIELPRRFPLKSDFLSWHKSEIFQR
jgi:predicted restriction endonuclease